MSAAAAGKKQGTACQPRGKGPGYCGRGYAVRVGGEGQLPEQVVGVLGSRDL